MPPVGRQIVGILCAFLLGCNSGTPKIDRPTHMPDTLVYLEWIPLQRNIEDSVGIRYPGWKIYGVEYIGVRLNENEVPCAIYQITLIQQQ